MYQITPKVYEIDYEFIIKNYLNTEQWGKVWTLLVYKEFTFNLTMTRIDPLENSVMFQIKLTHPEHCSATQDFKYNLNTSNIDMLKKSIQGNIYRCIYCMESDTILVKSRDISNMKCEERERIEEIAEEYLKEKGIVNKSVIRRTAENYAYDNERIYDLHEDYNRSKQYTEFSDLYLTYAEIYKDTDLERKVNVALENNKSREILEEIEDYYAYMTTDKWSEEIKAKLEKE